MKKDKGRWLYSHSFLYLNISINMKRAVAKVRWKLIYCNEKNIYSIDIYDKHYEGRSIENLLDKINKDIRKREAEEFDEICRKNEYFWEHYWQYYD